jgi:SAM-dependent methyltransferase
MLRLTDVTTLACPSCGGDLLYRGAVHDDLLTDGALACRACAARFEVRKGTAALYREAEVTGTDRLLRRVYDGLPGVHDPLVRFSFPWAVGEREQQSRSRYLQRLRLERLRDEVGAARPARILEIGGGTGSNVPLLRERERAGGVPLEIWAVDLSLGMLRLFEERMRFAGDGATRALLADAHALPFPAGAFDRVFHVGAVNGYRDPGAALREMARVARPGTPIVVVDERLDPAGSHGLLRRLFFKWMTIYDRDPHAPVEHLPPDATEVRVEQLGRFFYCLTFETLSTRRTLLSAPAPAPPPSSSRRGPRP